MSKRLFVLALVAGLVFGASPAQADSASQVAGGADHTCALTAGGSVLCWGAGFYGQLGSGSRDGSLTPAPVVGLSSGVTAVAAGQYHTCAVTAGGGVLCWGYNADGELGDGTTDDRLTPTAVAGLDSGVESVATAAYHSCALTTGGEVLCWGANWFGQLGDGTTVDSAVPVPVAGLPGPVTAIAAGGYYSCALTAGGEVLCWGANWFGQLGNGTTDASPAPVSVTGLAAGVATIGAGWDHACAVTAGGALLCWGSNWYGALGDGTADDRLTPTAVSGLGFGVKAVTAGIYHTCALTAEGGVLCWGAVAYAGHGNPASYTLTPAAVSGLASGTASVTAGAYHSCAVTVRGGVACWGSNGWGQLGDGTTADSAEPLPAVDFEGRRSTPGDFTGDGIADVLWRHLTNGDMWLWGIEAAARATDAYVGAVADPNWEIRSVGDLNGDGLADLLWRHKLDGALYYWPMHGGAPAAQQYVATADTSYDIVGTGDFDGDGVADVLWRGATGDLWLWRMSGATVLSEQYVDTVDLSYAVKGLGDVDGDFKTDVIWQGAGGDIWVWLMNGAARSAQTHVGTVTDGTYQIQQVADVDADLKADVIWWGESQGDVWVWRMSGGAVLSEHYVGLVPDTNYRIQAAGDYDGDGKADLLWRNSVAGDLWIWRMDGPAKASEHYLGIVADQGYRIVR